MPYLGLKYAWVSDSEYSSVSLEGLYFKTYPYGDRLFEQESYFLRLTYGFEYFNLWNVYFSGGYQYFFNDKRAYSLRAVTQSDDPRTLSISMLQVWNFHRQAAILIELGILGMNYAVPFQHYGASINLRFDKWMIQLGFSQGVSRSAIDYEIDDDGRMYWSGTSKGYLQHQVVSITHPELQIQYLFE